MTFKEFLENQAPLQPVEVTLFAALNHRNSSWYLTPPRIQLHCGEEECGRLQWFDYTGEEQYIPARGETLFVTYRCANCTGLNKLFALWAWHKEAQTWNVLKVGEYPGFGSPVPPKLMKLLTQDRENLLKGFRAESRGMGIGAFAYYRRVVEGQKAQILTEVIKVAEQTGAESEVIELLKRARKENQFEKSIAMVKDAIPSSLRLPGNANPLTLLHDALSEGIHAETDEECLEIAQSIRVILTDLSNRCAEILRDQDELAEAVAKLNMRKSQRSQGRSGS